MHRQRGGIPVGWRPYRQRGMMTWIAVVMYSIAGSSWRPAVNVQRPTSAVRWPAVVEATLCDAVQTTALIPVCHDFVAKTSCCRHFFTFWSGFSLCSRLEFRGRHNRKP